MLPAVITLAVTAFSAMFIYLDSGGFRPSLEADAFWFHFYFGMLHLSMVLGLILSLVCCIYSAVMCILGFILKTWLGALLALGISIFSFLILHYLLNTTI